MIGNSRGEGTAAVEESPLVHELLEAFGQQHKTVAEIWLGHRASHNIAHILVDDRSDNRYLRVQVAALCVQLEHRVGPSMSAELSPLDPRQAAEAVRRGLFYERVYQRERQL